MWGIFRPLRMWSVFYQTNFRSPSKQAVHRPCSGTDVAGVHVIMTSHIKTWLFFLILQTSTGINFPCKHHKMQEINCVFEGEEISWTWQSSWWLQQAEEIPGYRAHLWYISHGKRYHAAFNSLPTLNGWVSACIVLDAGWPGAQISKHPQYWPDIQHLLSGSINCYCFVRVHNKEA